MFLRSSGFVTKYTPLLFIIVDESGAVKFKCVTSKKINEQAKFVSCQNKCSKSVRLSTYATKELLKISYLKHRQLRGGNPSLSQYCSVEWSETIIGIDIGIPVLELSKNFRNELNVRSL